MGRIAAVILSGEIVGELREGEDGMVTFFPDDRYRSTPSRPVMGQWFEDHPGEEQTGVRPGRLPPFFANYVPEGHLRALLEERLGVAQGDDLGLLLAVGRDLPGAIEVHSSDLLEFPVIQSSEHSPTLDMPEEEGLRFSLAGIQLKFSLLRTGDRFNLPGRDSRGDWIAKVSLSPYHELSANEYLTMEWARQAGFDVPACELLSVESLVDVPHGEEPGSPIFLIKRFDREPGRKVHQEDFQQILGRDPGKKYSDGTYETVAVLAERIVGPAAFEETVRRLIFMVASGNSDAHFKNWSIIYPDGVHAALSPLYDQVFTAQWKQFSAQMALKLGGTKAFSAVDVRRFQELARRSNHSSFDIEEFVNENVTRIQNAWQTVRALASDKYRQELRRHWTTVPLLHAHSLLI